MDTNLTRRSLLRAMPAAALAVALPMSAVAAAPETLPKAIATYQQARRAVSKSTVSLAKIEEANPDATCFPRVCYGKLVKGYDEAGDKITEPLYAYSLKEIEQRRLQMLVPWVTPVQVAKFNARFDGYVAEWKRQDRRRQRIARECGYTAALKANAAAWRAEERAYVALLMVRPVTEEEARRKERFVRRCPMFREDSIDPERIVPLVLELTIAVEQHEARR